MRTLTKRILSMALAVCLCLSMLPALALQVNATVAYDPDAAVAYAAAHATDTPEISGADCANFVSKCVSAGGIPVSEKVCHNLMLALEPYAAKVTNLEIVISNGYGRVPTGGSNTSILSKGDVMFVCCERCKQTGNNYERHAVIYSGESDSNGYAKCYAHTSMANNTTFWVGYNGTYACSNGHATSYLAAEVVHFESSASPHTCNKGTYVYYEAMHPHYKCYQCSRCGNVWRNTAEPTIVDSCAECVPSKTIDDRYSSFFPIAAFPLSTGHINVYDAAGNQLGNRYIDGATDICIIWEVYTDGWCKVRYPSSAEAAGYFDAYVPLSTFTKSTYPSWWTAPMDYTTYRRSDLASKMHSVSNGEDCMLLITSGSVKQIIHFVEGQSYSMMGWINDQNTHTHNYTGARTYENAHPHRIAQRCVDYATCGGWIWTDEYYKLKTCEQCWHVTFNIGASSISVKAGESKTVSATVGGCLPDSAVLHRSFSPDNDVVEVTIKNQTVTFTGLKAGKTDFSLTVYSDSSKSRVIGTITIPVTVTAQTYTVSYNVNGGTGAPSNQTKYHGISLTLSTTKPTRTGYTFLGWATSSIATSAIYQPGDSFTGNANITLYAVWKQGCENGSHSYSYKATKTPTVSTTGILTGTCSKCSGTTMVTLPKLNTTDYSYNVVKAATCTVAGTGRYTWKTTTYGNFYFDVTIGKTSHSHTAKVTAPTCTEQGYTTYTCRCGDSYISDYVASLGHDMGKWYTTKEATCTEGGEQRRDCSRCDHYETQVITSAGHSYSKKVTAPTCTEQGYTTYTCSVCSYSHVNDYLPSRGHAMGDWYTTKESTCYENGTKRRDCSRCDHFETRSIPSGHSYIPTVTAPTCTEQGYTTYTCSVCSYSHVNDYLPSRGHAMGNWYITKEATCTEDGAQRRDCSRCDHFETDVITSSGHHFGDDTVCDNCGFDSTSPEYPENALMLSGEEFADQDTVWINGLPYPIQGEGNDRYVELSTEDDCYMVTYTYHTGDASDIHTQYPTGMKVYKVSDGQITYIPELDNLLQYSGASIRITGKKGIRMITSLTKTNKTALTGKGLAGFKLLEYGTALCFAHEIPQGDALVLGRDFTRSNYAYKKGVADPVFASTKDLIQYTNVLVGFSLDQCKDDIAMRPYIILEDAAGNQITLYGGTIYRSIGYIAYQNRTVFKPKTASYNYVWELIHHVYGDQYDADYKG